MIRKIFLGYFVTGLILILIAYFFNMSNNEYLRKKQQQKNGTCDIIPGLIM